MRFLLAVCLALVVAFGTGSLAYGQDESTASEGTPPVAVAEDDVDAEEAPDEGLSTRLEAGQTPAGTPELADDDFAPGLLIGAMAVTLFVLFIAVVLLVVFTAVLAAALAIAVGIGAAAVFLGLSTTAGVVGATRRSFGAGMEALLAQCGALAGAPCGIATAWVAHHFAGVSLEFHVSRPLCLVLGAVSGVAAGAATGMILGRSLRGLAARFRRTPT